jgi:FAD synthetase
MARKTVMAFGSFDILHPGHIHYLERAASLGDSLIVVVARDASIRKLKGRKPAFRERDRLHMVGSLRVVTKAVLGRKSKPKEFYRTVLKYRPDIIALGYDQQADPVKLRKLLESNGLKTRIVRIRSSLNKESYKSSIIRKRQLNLAGS